MNLIAVPLMGFLQDGLQVVVSPIVRGSRTEESRESSAILNRLGGLWNKDNFAKFQNNKKQPTELLGRDKEVDRIFVILSTI